jgi:hypothetical protein
MRSVRCDVCGTKALMAASQCPKCGHPFAVRDGSGALLPLSHCSTCNSDYPATIGSCKWCGTMPERAPIGPWIWKGIGIAAFVSMAWGAWLVHDDKPAAPSNDRLQSILKPDSTAPLTDSARATQTLASGNAVDTPGVDTNAIVTNAADTTDRATTTSVVLVDSTATSMPMAIASRDSTISVQSSGAIAEPDPVVALDSTPIRPVARESVRESARASTTPPVRAPTARQRDVVRAPVRVPSGLAATAPARTPARVAVRSPAKAAPRVAVSPKSSAPSRKAVRWTNSVARSWVIVRADPSRRSRIIASIGPNTRVQLGEARGEWRRIKAKGLSGWVEHRLLVARVPPAKRAGRFAAR